MHSFDLIFDFVLECEVIVVVSYFSITSVFKHWLILDVEGSAPLTRHTN